MRTTRIGVRWTPAEDVLVRELYPDHPARHIAELLERTVAAVQARALKLGVRKSVSEVASLTPITKKSRERRQFCRRQHCPYATRIAKSKSRCLQPSCMQEGVRVRGSAT